MNFTDENSHTDTTTKEQLNSSHDKMSTMDQFKFLPKYLEQVSQNINNIDNKIHQQKDKETTPVNSSRHIPVSNKISPNLMSNNVNVSKSHAMQECFDIKNLVKQSVDGLNDIFNSKIKKNPINSNHKEVNIHSNKKIPESAYNINKTLDLEKEEIIKTSGFLINPNQAKNKQSSNLIKDKKIKINIKDESTNLQSKNKKESNKIIKGKLNYENSITNPSNISDNNIVSLLQPETSSVSPIVPSANKYTVYKRNNYLNEEKSAPSNSVKNSNSNVNNKLSKNIQVLKDKITNLNLMKKDGVSSENENLDLEREKENKLNSGLRDSNNLLTSSQHLNRRKSLNERYENETLEKESSTNLKSKSPIGGIKSFQFKPKTKKEEISNSNINVNSYKTPNTAQSRGKSVVNSSNYLSEGKSSNLSKDSNSSVLTKKPSTRLLTSNKNLQQVTTEKVRGVSAASRNPGRKSSATPSSERGNLSGRQYMFNKHPRNSIEDEYEMNPMVQMLFLFNEISQTKTKNEGDKLLSEDFSKLLIHLIEEEPKVEDERKILEENIPSYDKEKVIVIQRRWRKYKIKYNLKLKEDNKINVELKNDLLHSIHSNELYFKISSHINSALKLFKSMTKTRGKI
jgi:hypothetical protein